MFYQQLEENYENFGVTITVLETSSRKSKSIELTVTQIRNLDTFTLNFKIIASSEYHHGGSRCSPQARPASCHWDH
jgi:hypothetical protein